MSSKQNFLALCVIGFIALCIKSDDPGQQPAMPVLKASKDSATSTGTDSVFYIYSIVK